MSPAALLGPKILFPFGCVYKRWKNFVLQPAAGRRTQFFILYSRNQREVIFLGPVQLILDAKRRSIWDFSHALQTQLGITIKWGIHMENRGFRPRFVADTKGERRRQRRFAVIVPCVTMPETEIRQRWHSVGREGGRYRNNTKLNHFENVALVLPNQRGSNCEVASKGRGITIAFQFKAWRAAVIHSCLLIGKRPLAIITRIWNWIGKLGSTRFRDFVPRFAPAIVMNPLCNREAPKRGFKVARMPCMAWQMITVNKPLHKIHGNVPHPYLC